MNLKLTHLSNKILGYSCFHYDEGNSNEKTTQAWNTVYDELSFHNRVDLIGQLASISLDQLSDSTKMKEEKIKSLIQGLSNLKNENIETLNFSQLMENNPQDNIALLIAPYLKEPTNTNLGSVIKSLSEKILSQDLDKQSQLWERAREEFSKPIFDNNTLKNFDVPTIVTETAMNFISTAEQRSALIFGICGMTNLDKRKNVSNAISKMRNESHHKHMQSTKNTI